jgi:hypothetical protein
MTMHSAVLSSTGLPQSQENRLVNLLEKTPRFSPWGVKNWTAPKGFKFQTIDHVPVPETVLSRDSDHSAVLIIERYSNLVFASQDHIVLTNVKDVVPTLRIISVKDVESLAAPIACRAIENGTFFPFVNREEIRKMVPTLPRHICAHYMLGDQYFVWNWDSVTGLRSHNELTWFNRTNPDILTESITKLTRDPISGMLVGEGNNVPPFVLSADGFRLMSFIRTYDASTGRVNNGHLLDKWRERLGTDAARAMLL